MSRYTMLGRESKGLGSSTLFYMESHGISIRSRRISHAEDTEYGEAVNTMSLQRLSCTNHG